MSADRMRDLSATPEIIRTGTRPGPVPLVPEIRLHQASDPIGLWQRTELAAGRTGLDPPFWAFAWAGGQALARYLLDHPEAVRAGTRSTSPPARGWWRSRRPWPGRRP